MTWRKVSGAGGRRFACWAWSPPCWESVFLKKTVQKRGFLSEKALPLECSLGTRLGARGVWVAFFGDGAHPPLVVYPKDLTVGVFTTTIVFEFLTHFHLSCRRSGTGRRTWREQARMGHLWEERDRHMAS